MRSADYDSFQELNAVFAKDKAVGYYRGITLSGSMGLSFTALDERYAKDNAMVFYCDNYIDFKLFETSRKNKISQVSGADANSFQVIGYDYAKDKVQAYYRETGFAVNDVATFKPIDYMFGQDKEVGYFYLKPISGSDGSSFEVLSRNFARDNKAVYYAWSNLDTNEPPGICVIKEAQPTSFTTVGLFYATDAKHAFYRNNVLAEADPSSFKQWDDVYTDYAHDSTHVYFQYFLIPAADKSTFSILLDHYSHDAKTVFYEATPLKGADLASFHMLERGYAKDAKRVYYKGKVLRGADPISFVMVNNEVGRDAADKVHSYAEGRWVKLDD